MNIMCWFGHLGLHTGTLMHAWYMTASPGMYHMVSSSPYNILCRKKENSAGGEITLHKGPPYPQSDP